MRVPVIAVLPRHEPLLESATASLESRAAKVPIERTPTPSGLTIDPTVPAVALGSSAPANLSISDVTGESVQPNNAQSFAVKGFVDVEDPADVPAELDGSPLFADPAIAPYVTCGGTPPVGSASTVASKLNVAALARRGLDGDGVAVAIMDTGINVAYLRTKLGTAPRFDAANSWMAPGNPTLPGNHPVHHGTMCAFDVLIAAPKATLLDFPILRNSAPGGSAMSGTLSTALLAFSQLMASWAVSFAPGGTASYKALVVNNSWGMYHPSWDLPAGHPGRYCDNPSHPFNIIVGALARANADILFAAGNCGAACSDMRCHSRVTETIMGANAIADVLTVAGCDTHDNRVGYSSQGPAIAGMFHDKPDIITYTHFLGSEAFGAGSPDSGTSTACPVAAGCIAALRTKLPPVGTPSANLISQIKATARRRPGQLGWDADYGHGYLDPDAVGHSFGV